MFNFAGVLLRSFNTSLKSVTMGYSIIPSSSPQQIYCESMVMTPSTMLSVIARISDSDCVYPEAQCIAWSEPSYCSVCLIWTLIKAARHCQCEACLNHTSSHRQSRTSARKSGGTYSIPMSFYLQPGISKSQKVYGSIKPTIFLTVPSNDVIWPPKHAVGGCGG